MWKALINKIFKKAKTAEGLGAIGSGTFFGWIGNISGLVSPKVFAFLGFSFTGINALIPFAAFGAILGYFGVKTFKYWKLRHKVEKMKKKSKEKLIVPKWLKRPMDTAYLKLFRKHIKNFN